MLELVRWAIKGVGALCGWRGLLLSAGIWGLLAFMSLEAYKGTLYNVTDIWLYGMGGISASGSFDLMGLIRWFAGLFPCVGMNLVFFNRESSTRLVYVLPRMNSYTRWWLSHAGLMIIWSFLYAWMGFLILSGAYGFSPSAQVGQSELFAVLPLLLFAYPLHVALLSCGLSIIGLVLGPQFAQVFFVLVEGLTAIIGGKLTDFSIFLFGSWGMAVQLRNDLKNAGLVALVQLLLLAVLLSLGRKFMRLSLNRAKSQ